MPAQFDVILFQSDNIIEVSNLKDAVTGALLTGATIEVRVLEDREGAEVAGGSWPVVLAEIVQGLYRGTIPDTVTLLLDHTYYVETVVNAGPGLQRKFIDPANAVV